MSLLGGDLVAWGRWSQLDLFSVVNTLQRRPPRSPWFPFGVVDEGSISRRGELDASFVAIDHDSRRSILRFLDLPRFGIARSGTHRTAAYVGRSIGPFAIVATVGDTLDAGVRFRRRQPVSTAIRGSQRPSSGPQLVWAVFVRPMAVEPGGRFPCGVCNIASRTTAHSVADVTVSTGTRGVLDIGGSIYNVDKLWN